MYDFKNKEIFCESYLRSRVIQRTRALYKTELLSYGTDNKYIYFEDDVMHVDITFK